MKERTGIKNRGKKIQLSSILFLFAPMIVLLFAALAAIALASATTIVCISPSTQTVSQGESFTVNVSIAPDTAIAGAQVNLKFNSSLVQVNSVTEGDLFKQSGFPTFFLSGEMDNTTGVIKGVACNILGQANVSTSGTFAIIGLTASSTTSGTSPLDLIDVPPISVRVSDPDGNLLPIEVVNGSVRVNCAPVLSTIGDKSVDEGSLLEFTISAYDPDGDTLTYSASNLPSGASFDASSRTFSWTPTYDQAGTYTNVHFEVSDGHLTDSEDITITVHTGYPPYDINKDGIIDICDLTIVGQYYGEGNSSYDLNGDNVVDIGDLVIIGQHFGELST